MDEPLQQVGTGQEIDWSTLLTSIEDDLVVPIIGPDLIRINEAGKSLSMDAWLVCQLEKQGFFAPGSPTPQTLNEAVWRMLEGVQTRRIPGKEIPERRTKQQIGSDLAKIIKTLPAAPPLALEQLAKIPRLKLFVTTNMDTLLETALNTHKYNGSARTKSIFYNPSASPLQKDLNAPEIPVQETVVFHLFGKFGPGDGGVLTEHDLIEYLLSMHTNDRPKNLLQVLSQSYLLFIGCGQSDWLARFFFRSAKQTKLANNVFGMEMISDLRTPRDPRLVDYLNRVEMPRIQVDDTGDPTLFVNELSKRWQEAHPTTEMEYVPPTDAMPEHAVFISYRSEDLDAVIRLKNGLDAAGIVSWFDKDRLTVGDWFTPKIEEAIKSSRCFIAVISDHTAVEKSYFFREWRFAVEQAKLWSRKFILPVIVSPGGASADLIPLDFRANFRQANMAYIPLGETSTNPGFIQEVKALVQPS